MNNIMFKCSECNGDIVKSGDEYKCQKCGRTKKLKKGSDKKTEDMNDITKNYDQVLYG